MPDTTHTRPDTRAQGLPDSATLDRAAAEPGRGAPASTASPQVFYTYQNPEGRLVIVDSLDQVPVDMRPRVERLTEGATTSAAANESWFRFSNWDVPSFSLGFGSALLVIGAVTLLVRSRRALAALLGVGLALALGAAYLGWLRRSTVAAPGALFASPQQIIEDAKHAVDRANRRQAEQEQTIEQIQREAR